MLDSFFNFTQNLGIPNLVVYFLVVVVALYIYGTWGFNVFKNVVGCDGPKPIPFLGTSLEYFKKGLWVDLEFKKKYGRSYGVFDGLNPIFVTGDLELIKQIAIKEFDCFVNHRRVCINWPLNQAIGMIKDNAWRQQRPATARTVTASKLKKISLTVIDCAKEMVNNLRPSAQKGEMIEIHNWLGNFTMDVIARTQFALELHSHDDPNHPFIHHATKMFSSWTVFQPAMLLYMFVPKVLPFIEYFNIKYFKIFPAESVEFFKNIILGVIKYRTTVDHGQKYTDFVQALLDITKEEPKKEEDEDEEASEIVKSADNYNQQMSKGVKIRAFSDIQIAGGSITLLLAGYETTASTLAWLSYALSLHQDVQEKLYKEVRGVLDSGKEINYENAMKMQYLDQVVNETLRRYSVVMRTDRICNKTCQVGPYTIPKGMCVQISALGVHFDEEYFPDPMKFDPERFAPENRHNILPNSILTFGVGPRICLGTRFAMLEIKIALALMIAEFQFLPCEKTEVPITYKKHQLALPENGIWVTLKPRNQ